MEINEYLFTEKVQIFHLGIARHHQWWNEELRERGKKGRRGEEEEEEVGEEVRTGEKQPGERERQFRITEEGGSNRDYSLVYYILYIFFRRGLDFHGLIAVDFDVRGRF